jgi:hypothetical protein
MCQKNAALEGTSKALLCQARRKWIFYKQVSHENASDCTFTLAHSNSIQDVTHILFRCPDPFRIQRDIVPLRHGHDFSVRPAALQHSPLVKMLEVGHIL